MAKGEGEKEAKMDAEAMKAEMEKRKKEAEEAKKIAELKKAERLKVIAERIGEPKNLDGLDDAALRVVMNDLYARDLACAEAIYEMERKCLVSNIEITELNTKVLDLRGKFIKPNLRKVTIDFDELS